MKRSLSILVVVAVAAVSILGAMLVTASPTPAAPTAAQPLTEQEALDLQFAREEEKLARDVYSFLDGVWGDQIGLFANIAVSEDTHTLAIRDLLKKYRVDDPAKHDVPGEFVNAVLQHEYDHLVAEGSASLVAALEVGVYIEEMDIVDLSLFQWRTTRSDIERVYGNLIDGSYSHLAAFKKALE
jgi:hypothetical protein